MSHMYQRSRKWRRVILVFLASIACGAQLTGCNTTEGAGKDIEKLGENIQDAAN